MRGCLLIVQPTRRGDREREHGRGECQASESRGWHWFTGVARARRRPRATMILRMTKANSRVLSSLNARLNCSKNRTRARRRPRFRKAKRDSNTSVSGHTRSPLVLSSYSLPIPWRPCLLHSTSTHASTNGCRPLPTATPLPIARDGSYAPTPHITRAYITAFNHNISTSHTRCTFIHSFIHSRFIHTGPPRSDGNRSGP